MSSTIRGDGSASGSNGGGPESPSSSRALLMAGNALAPCVGCTLECFPRSCELFTAWLGLLERGPRGPGGHP